MCTVVRQRHCPEASNTFEYFSLKLKCFSFVFQKSLWDTIKNKRKGENVAVPRRMKTKQPLKMAANKTFQVSRTPQYKREKPRSPLASLNEGKALRERSLSKLSPIDDYSRKSEEKKALNSTPEATISGLVGPGEYP